MYIAFTVLKNLLWIIEYKLPWFADYEHIIFLSFPTTLKIILLLSIFNKIWQKLLP